MSPFSASAPARRRRVSELRALVEARGYAVDPDLVAAAVVQRVALVPPPAERCCLTPVGARSPAPRPRRPESC